MGIVSAGCDVDQVERGVEAVVRQACRPDGGGNGGVAQVEFVHPATGYLAVADTPALAGPRWRQRHNGGQKSLRAPGLVLSGAGDPDFCPPLWSVKVDLRSVRTSPR